MVLLTLEAGYLRSFLVGVHGELTSGHEVQYYSTHKNALQILRIEFIFKQTCHSINVFIA